jgi:hypothetical protein
MGGPDQQVGQPHRRPDEEQEPERPHLGPAPKHVLKREQGRRSREADLQEVAQQAKLKAFRENKRGEECHENRECGQGVAEKKETPGMPYLFGRRIQRVGARFHD